MAWPRLRQVDRLIGASVLTSLAMTWLLLVGFDAFTNFARQLGDAPEARGQWARLGLTLVGHLVRRLPQGNIGRASVPALRPMVPSVAVRACITEAMQATQPPGTPGAPEMSQIDL